MSRANFDICFRFVSRTSLVRSVRHPSRRLNQFLHVSEKTLRSLLVTVLLKVFHVSLLIEFHVRVHILALSGRLSAAKAGIQKVAQGIFIEISCRYR